MSNNNYYAYDRSRAVTYAKAWALSRNPLFIDYTGVGGDCTNFVSQCVYAGCCTMSFTPVFGWYYITSERRTASWTGVEFFYNFLTREEGVGPVGSVAPLENAEPGDVIQLARNEQFYHTLVVSGFDGSEILVCAHSLDALDRPLSSYQYDTERLIKINGVLRPEGEPVKCFPGLIAGKELNI